MAPLVPCRPSPQGCQCVPRPVVAARGVPAGLPTPLRSARGKGGQQWTLPAPYLAVEASVALGAGALVGPVAVLAGAPVQAGFGVALVDVVLAVDTREARRAHAGEGVDSVHTGAAVEAGAVEQRKRLVSSSPHLSRAFGLEPGTLPNPPTIQAAEGTTEDPPWQGSWRPTTPHF